MVVVAAVHTFGCAFRYHTMSSRRGSPILLCSSGLAQPLASVVHCVTMGERARSFAACEWRQSDTRGCWQQDKVTRTLAEVMG